MTEPTPPPATPPAEGDVNARLSRMEGMISAFVGSAHQGAERHMEHRLDRPQTVAEQVDAALRQADQSRRADEQTRATKTAIDTLAQTVKELKESKPSSPVRPIESLFWGRRR